MKLKSVSYAEARLEFFREQLAHAERVLTWWTNNSADWNICSQKGAIVSYYEDIVKMLEGKEHK